MADINIKSHEFDAAKQGLKDFSQKISTSVILEEVDTKEGLFKLFDHRVTGQELNELVSRIQSVFISMNNIQKKSIQEFGQVYTALEALDKDYIQYILLSVKAAEKASEQAKDSARCAMDNSRDIKEVIVVQQKTVEELIKFKNKMSMYLHLGDIDEIYADCKALLSRLDALENRLTVLELNCTQYNRLLENHIKQNDTDFSKQDIDNVLIETQSRLSVFENQLQSVENTNDIYNSRFESLSARVKLQSTFITVLLFMMLVSFVLSVLGVL